MLVKFLETVSFEGEFYKGGEKYDLSEEQVAALGDSVEPASAEKAQKPAKDKMVKEAKNKGVETTETNPDEEQTEDKIDE